MLEVKPEKAAGRVKQFFNKTIKGEETDDAVGFDPSYRKQ